MKININKITTKGKAIYLAYDQGLEHGPTDFNDLNVDPQYILDIGLKGGFNGIIFQKGVAEKYYDIKKHRKLPLIIKLNGKTSFQKGEALSLQICSVKEAKQLGAVAVGYTIYLGSAFEEQMIAEFGKIVREAHQLGMPVIAWMYPRGKDIKNDKDPKVLAYAARTGLELGADMVKIKYSGSPKTFTWITKAAGRCKVMVAGGTKKRSQKDLYKEVKDIMKSGASGLAIGRNIWQAKNPLEISKQLKDIVFTK